MSKSAFRIKSIIILGRKSSNLKSTSWLYQCFIRGKRRFLCYLYRGTLRKIAHCYPTQLSKVAVGTYLPLALVTKWMRINGGHARLRFCEACISARPSIFGKATHLHTYDFSNAKARSERYLISARRAFFGKRVYWLYFGTNTEETASSGAAHKFFGIKTHQKHFVSFCMFV